MLAQYDCYYVVKPYILSIYGTVDYAVSLLQSRLNVTVRRLWDIASGAGVVRARRKTRLVNFRLLSNVNICISDSFRVLRVEYIML
jgi:hypothetical protein